ncbi:MAG: hypothetical protein AAF078_09180 [Planctomycetota bacterium]
MKYAWTAAVIAIALLVVGLGPVVGNANEKAKGKYTTKTKYTVDVDTVGTSSSSFTEKFKVSGKKVKGKSTRTGKQADGDDVRLTATFNIKLKKKAEVGKKIKVTGTIVDSGENLTESTMLTNTYDITSGKFQFKSNRKGDLSMKGKTTASGDTDLGSGSSIATTVSSSFRGKD